MTFLSHFAPHDNLSSTLPGSSWIGLATLPRMDPMHSCPYALMQSSLGSHLFSPPLHLLHLTSPAGSSQSAISFAHFLPHLRTPAGLIFPQNCISVHQSVCMSSRLLWLLFLYMLYCLPVHSLRISVHVYSLPASRMGSLRAAICFLIEL